MRTGPKTIKGKRRSSQNALRHGLSRSFRRDAACDEAAKSLARQILGSLCDPEYFGLACGIAEALLDINRLRHAEYEYYSLSKFVSRNHKGMKAVARSLDIQVNRYLSRAHGRLRSKIRQFDRACLMGHRSGLNALGSLFRTAMNADADEFQNNNIV